MRRWPGIGDGPRSCNRGRHFIIDYLFLQNERYAMLVVMPSERDNGLRGLVDRLDYGTLKQLSAELKLQTVDLSLPKFSVETTSTVHKEFAEVGLPQIRN